MVIDPAAIATPPPDPAAAVAAATAAALAAVSAPPADPIDVPPSDKRAYRRFALPNGMSVLLIHDPSMAEAAAAGLEEDKEGKEEGGTAAAARGARAQPGRGGGDGSGTGTGTGSGTGSGSGSGGSSEDGSGSSSGDDGGDDGGDGDDSASELAELAGSGDEGGGGPAAPTSKQRAPTKKAAAAMAVATGSLADPPALPGLAHYLEHMLFMGSAKFPDENDYDAFLARHGGGSNAWTDMEDTVFYFDATPPALLPALDRFAQFFTCPLVKADALDREVGAVDNEFSGVLQSDGCRLAQLRAHTAAPGHPFARFAWGNRASLADGPRAAGVDVRAAILDFYARQYGAERMSLVVLGGQPLAELAAAVGAAFGAVPAGVGPPSDFASAGPPYTGGALHISPAVKDGHTLTLAWCLPPLAKRYRAKAEDYLAHLIGHEGAGSLLAALKARGWATGLSAGVGDGGTDRSSAAYVFEVSVTLTDAGLEAGPGAGLAAAGLLFSYVGLLARAGPQAWVHEEVAAIAAARFRFAEEEDAAEYAARLAADARRYPPSDTLAGPYRHDEWDPALVADLTARLSPGGARLDLQTSAAAGVLPPPAAPKGGGGGKGEGGKEEVGGAPAAPPPAPTAPPPGRLAEWVTAPGATKGVEPWFGLPYAAVPLPADLLAGWGAAAAGEGGEGAESDGPAPALALPAPNPFIPTDFSLRCEDGGEGAAATAGAASPRSPPPTPPGAAAAKRARPAEVGEGEDGMEEDGGDPTAAPPASAPTHPSFPLLPPPACLCRPPALLLDERGLRVWHKTDATFRVPRAVARAAVSPAGADASPAAAAVLHAAIRLLEDAMCEEAYLAEVAGLGLAAWPEGRAGFELRFDGFSHRLPALVRAVFAGLAALPATIAARPDAFTRVIEGLARKYRNANMRPDRHATFLRLAALKRVWSPEAVLAELEALTPATLAAALPPLLADCHVELLVQGNMTAGEALALARDAWGALEGEGEGGGGAPAPAPAAPTPTTPPLRIRASRLPADDRPADRVVRLPHGCSYLHRAAARNPAEPNSVVEVYCQIGPADDPRARAALDLAAAAAHEPAYNQLRTVEQLGYAVHAGARCTHGVLGYAVTVVSGEHGPAHLDARVEAWLAGFAGRLADLPAAEFEAHRAALAASKAQADRALAEEADRHWEAVGGRRYEFLGREADLDALAGLAQGDVAALWAQAIAPGPTRRRLAVHVCGAGAAAELGHPPPPGSTLVEDLGEMKAGLALHPPPKVTLPRPTPPPPTAQ